MTDLLVVVRETIKTLKVNSDKCRAALTLNMLTTDLAYYLVRKGVKYKNLLSLLMYRITCTSDLYIQCFLSMTKLFDIFQQIIIIMQRTIAVLL